MPAPGGPNSMILTIFSYKLLAPMLIRPAPLCATLIRIRGRVLYLKYPAQGPDYCWETSDSLLRDIAAPERYLAGSLGDSAILGRLASLKESLQP